MKKIWYELMDVDDILKPALLVLVGTGVFTVLAGVAALLYAWCM